LDAITAALLEEVEALKVRVEVLEGVLTKIAIYYFHTGGDLRYLAIFDEVLHKRGGTE